MYLGVKFLFVLTPSPCGHSPYILLRKTQGDFGRVTLLSSYIDDVVSALRSDIQCAWINYEWGGIQCEQAVSHFARKI